MQLLHNKALWVSRSETVSEFVKSQLSTYQTHLPLRGQAGLPHRHITSFRSTKNISKQKSIISVVASTTESVHATLTYAQMVTYTPTRSRMHLCTQWGLSASVLFTSGLKYTQVCDVFVVQSLSRVWLFANPWAAAHQASLSFIFSGICSTHVHWVGDAIHLILCYPLLLLPSIFPSIRVFSNELALSHQRENCHDGDR